MLVFLTVAVTLAVAYAAMREGFLMAVAGLVNVLVAGVVAFNFYEPVAGELEGMLAGSFLAGFEDALALFLLFALPLILLRVVCNNLATHEVELPALFQQVGSAAVAAVTGYLLAGFLVCVFQTLPWGQQFLGFDATADPGAPKIRSLVPPDRVWLALMHRAGNAALSQEGSTTFDPEGTFELRYARLRRFKEQ
jgi:uncharacterized membrane protein required for colicin V production